MTVQFRGKLAQPGDIHSSNDLEINMALETSPGVLPAAASQYWRGLEINSFSSFGGSVETIRRRYFERRRQLGKSRVQAIRAEGAWQSDITDDQFGRVGRAFLFADDGSGAATNGANGAKPDTQSIFKDAPTNIGTITSAGVVTLTNTVAQLGTRAFINNDVALITDRGGGSNNGHIGKVSAASGTTITIAGAGAQAASSASSPNIPAVRIQAIGYDFAAGTAEMLTAGTPKKAYLNRKSGSVDWTAIGLQVGEWIFIGGDATGLKFDNPTNSGDNAPNGYARISAISASRIDFDDTTFVPAADTGSGKTIRIFYGDFLYNGNTKRTFTVERVLGKNATNQECADYILGACPNEATLNLEAESIANVDYSFIPLDSATVNFGETVCSRASGVFRVDRTGVGGYSTQNDVKRVKLQVKGVTDDLFAFVNSATIAVNNNVTGTTALGYRSYIGQNVGTFEGSGSVEALFKNPKAIEAIHENKSCYFNVIATAKDSREGFIFDLPECTVAGQPGAELDANITLPMDLSASEDPILKYTTSFTLFPYIPYLSDDL